MFNVTLLCEKQDEEGDQESISLVQVEQCRTALSAFVNQGVKKEQNLVGGNFTVPSLEARGTKFYRGRQHQQRLADASYIPCTYTYE